MMKNIILFLSQGLMTGDELYKLLIIWCIFQGGHRLRPQKIGLLLKSIRPLDYVAACSAAARKGRGHVGRFWKEKEKRKRRDKEQEKTKRKKKKKEKKRKEKERKGKRKERKRKGKEKGKKKEEEKNRI